LVRPKAKASVVFNDLYGKLDKNGIGDQMKKGPKKGNLMWIKKE